MRGMYIDEVLEVVMIVKSSSSECHGKLPNCLFDLLCRLQPILEVSYVPSEAQLVMTGSSTTFQSVNSKMSLKALSLSTEQRTYSTVPNDAQKHVLRSQIFGDGVQSNFDLHWYEKDKAWAAFYNFSVEICMLLSTMHRY